MLVELLSYQIFKTSALFRGQDFTETFGGSLDFGAQLGGNRLGDFPSAVLAFFQDLVNVVALFL